MKKYNDTLVTILMPTYNAGIKILAAVKSILNQTFQNWELIVLDDGSTDGSINFIKGLNDSRIKIISERKNRGIAYRLNQGIDLAHGKYIARMDADDISFSTRIEKQFIFLEKHPNVDLLGTRAVVFNDKNFTLGNYLPFSETHEELSAYPWRSFYVPHPTWMARTKWFKNNKYKIPDVIRAEDQELLLRAFKKSRYHCLPDPLLAYRKNPQSLGITWISRISLAREQARIFSSRKQWFFLLLSFLLFSIRVSKDLLYKLKVINLNGFNKKTKLSKKIILEFSALIQEEVSACEKKCIKKT